MKKIAINKLRKQLQEWNADESTTELIINNASLYNDAITQYKNSDNTKFIYICYQLNVQIVKQIESVKKSSGSNAGNNDPFEELVSSLKGNKTENR